MPIAHILPQVTAEFSKKFMRLLNGSTLTRLSATISKEFSDSLAGFLQNLLDTHGADGIQGAKSILLLLWKVEYRVPAVDDVLCRYVWEEFHRDPDHFVDVAYSRITPAFRLLLISLHEASNEHVYVGAVLIVGLRIAQQLRSGVIHQYSN